MLNPSKFQAFAENVQYTPKPILEATFYGKNEELLRVESILDDMVELGHAGKSGSTEFNDKMFEVSAILGRLFGFANMQINNSILCLMCPPLLFQLTNTAGCTLVHSAIVKYTKYTTSAVTGGTTEIVDFDKHHKGIKFKNNAKYSMRMFIGMELFEDHGEYSMTGGEILAIILHEIGHNFYVGPIREFGAEFLGMLTATELVKWLLSELQLIMLVEGSDTLDRMMPDSQKKQITALMNIIGTAFRPIYAAGNLAIIITNLLRMAVIIANVIVTIPLRAIRSVVLYDTEKYSDAFAASYGYGTELSSSLEKLGHMTMPGVTSSDMQLVLDFLFAMYRIPLSLIMLLIDVHPESNGRLHNNIKYMEAAGSKITDPKLKKEYTAAINQMYALRDQTKKYMGPNPIKLNNKLTACVQDLLHLSDPKDLASGLRPTLTKYANLDYTT
ncbi:hypothetical protein [uncultured Duncaniella sp.]|uniref:hypothetical protein n=1 Tax=uncultured Duncaniella sp. TaxID=2768039 RepID=UPI0026026C67|nr:hypothetical protein [uncultured Duncaniella sp.]